VRVTWVARKLHTLQAGVGGIAALEAVCIAEVGVGPF